MLSAMIMDPDEFWKLLPKIGWFRDGILPKLPKTFQGMTDAQKQDKFVKGFAWFNRFDEIHQWSANDVDSTQRATTPLFVRPGGATGPEPKLMVIHEPHVGYLDHEAEGVIGVMRPLYAMHHLQNVETFVYATKNLVSIPPPAWTTLMHKNGVRVLGTLYLDKNAVDKEFLLEYRVVDDDEKRRIYPVAEKLAQMARTYGFDGWMVSINTGFKYHTSTRLMTEFLVQLRENVYNEWESHYGATTGSVTEIVW
jgi:endo-beta-N-acetylglucosaminidase D